MRPRAQSEQRFYSRTIRHSCSHFNPVGCSSTGKMEKWMVFSLLGGDFFPRESAFVEQMTIWRNATTKKNEPPVFVPCRHDAAKQFWREFPSVFCKGEGNVHQPGVVRW